MRGWLSQNVRNNYSHGDDDDDDDGNDDDDFDDVNDDGDNDDNDDDVNDDKSDPPIRRACASTSNRPLIESILQTIQILNCYDDYHHHD